MPNEVEKIRNHIFNYCLHSFLSKTCVDTSCTDKQDKILRSCLFYNMSARHGRHECYKNDTRCDTIPTKTTRVRHEWKLLILIMARVCRKTYFQTWQMKDYKERNNFILRTTFWKCLVPMAKVHHKNWTL